MHSGKLRNAYWNSNEKENEMKYTFAENDIRYFHDHCSFRGIPAGVEFDVYEGPKWMLTLTAPGYGHRSDYGCGALLVRKTALPSEILAAMGFMADVAVKFRIRVSIEGVNADGDLPENDHEYASEILQEFDTEQAAELFLAELQVKHGDGNVCKAT
jgi:hypothetical protein